MSVCLIAGAFFMQKKWKGYWMEVNKEPVTKEDLKKNGYKEQYAIIVVCADAVDQKHVFVICKREFPEHPIKAVRT